jgi:hypothetical protein
MKIVPTENLGRGLTFVVLCHGLGFLPSALRGEMPSDFYLGSLLGWAGAWIFFQVDVLFTHAQGWRYQVPEVEALTDRNRKFEKALWMIARATGRAETEKEKAAQRIAEGALEDAK